MPMKSVEPTAFSISKVASKPDPRNFQRKQTGMGGTLVKHGPKAAPLDFGGGPVGGGCVVVARSSEVRKGTRAGRGREASAKGAQESDVREREAERKTARTNDR